MAGLGLQGEQWGEGGLPLPAGVSAGIFFPHRFLAWQEVLGTCWGLAGGFQKCLGCGLGVGQGRWVWAQPPSLVR